MREDHPVDHLVAMVDGTAHAAVVISMRALSRHLAARRQWVLGPAQLVDESDARGGRLLGLALSVFTARPPWGEELEPAVDRAHLDEIKEVLGGLCQISGELDASFVVEFAGELIGAVEKGRLDQSLAVGLIGEWERVLEERDG